MGVSGCIRLNGERVRMLRLERGWSRQNLRVKNLDVRTIRRAEESLPIRPGSARLIVERLGADLADLLHPSEQPDIEENAPGLGGSGINEWEEVRLLLDDVRASNGLVYSIHQMRHRHLGDRRFARGKRYDLSKLSTQERSRIEHHLRRHPDVCGRFRGHPHIPINFTACPGPNDECWWVIDDWVPGPTLTEVLREGPMQPKRLRRIMLEIAEGLAALHGVGVIRRELSPRFVILNEPDETVVLTDFELAKLLDGSHTVRKSWPENAYCAPEIESPNIDVRADLYSWGRILIHAATGKNLPPKGKEGPMLDDVRLPKRVRDITRACVSRACSRRPSGMDEVISAVRRWR